MGYAIRVYCDEIEKSKGEERKEAMRREMEGREEERRAEDKQAEMGKGSNEKSQVIAGLPLVGLLSFWYPSLCFLTSK